MHIGRLILLISFFTTIFSYAQPGEELDWPREIDIEKGVVTFYQPQIESYVANILEARSAISYKPTDGETLFGAYWFRAFLQTDLESRTTVLDQVDVINIKFPGLEDSLQVEAVKRKIESVLESMDIVMSLDRLITSLDAAGVNSNSVSGLNNSPPDIYYKKEPTVLISIDGDPIWKEMGQNGVKVVVNSPFFIVQDTKTKQYYINGGDFWYTSADALSEGWKSTEKVPSNVMKFAKDNAPEKEEGGEDVEDYSPTEPPKILVVTKPSELIVTDGEPDYKAVEGTNLLYVANTESDIILDIDAQVHYILLAGRWYDAAKLSGDKWSFSEPESLPADFANIPSDSDVSSVLTNVPGTQESRDALLEQSIPQTAEVSREDTKIEVSFDGQPKFKQVSGTEVSYAENSDKQVMKIGRKFYAVENGIWFVSDYPEGPYAVSDTRPAEVDDLPADSPVYNTKYVYVYDATPTTVYVGYTPGYTHAYVYNGVVVYGTGYRYPYWYGSVYYPRPVTYGFNVHYNPYSGWGFSFGISAGGWIGWGYHPYYRPYWGPCGYRYGYRGGYARGYHHGYNRGMANGYRAGYRSGQNNAYRNQRTGVKNTTLKNRGSIDRSRISKSKNNLYTDKNGNVFERSKGGDWKEKSNQRDRKGSVTREANKSNKASTRPSTDRNKPVTKPVDRTPSTRDKARTPNASPSTRPTKTPNRQPSTGNANSRNRQADLNRAAQNRQRGTQNYQRSRSAPQMNRSAPRSMPRGGRRR